MSSLPVAGDYLADYHHPYVTWVFSSKMTWGPMAFQPSSPILSSWHWPDMELKRSQDTGKISEKISGDLYPPVGGYDFISCLYVLCVSPTFMQNPVAYILGLSLVSKDSTFLLFQGIRRFSARLRFRNIAVKLVGVISIFLFCQITLVSLCILTDRIFELLGQLSMWLPAGSSLEAHFIMAYAQVHI